jgi:hypothetical protein
MKWLNIIVYSGISLVAMLFWYAVISRFIEVL